MTAQDPKIHSVDSGKKEAYLLRRPYEEGRVSRVWLVMVLMVSSIGLAQPPSVARGEDVTAWQLMEQRRLMGDFAVDAYREFVITYDESPLAVAAWDRLNTLSATGGEWREDAELRQALDDVERRWRAHRAVVESHKAPMTVARLFLDDDATVATD